MTHLVADLNRKREAFDKKRNAFLDHLATLPQEQLTEKTDPNGWTLLQVAQHLMLGERDVFQQLPNPTQLVQHQRSIRNRIMSWVVLGVLRLGIRVKVPSDAMIPDGRTTLDEVRAAWDESQNWLKEFVEGLDEQSVTQAVFYHPVSGPLSPSQALDLARVHFEGHLRKIDKRLHNFRTEDDVGQNPQ